MGYCFSDSSRSDLEGIRSKLRHPYLGLRDLEMTLLPARTAGYRGLHASFCLVKSSHTHLLQKSGTRDSLNDFPRIDKDTGVSQQCLILRHERQLTGSHALLFGYDLSGQPAIWFAELEESDMHEVLAFDKRNVLNFDHDAQIHLEDWPFSSLCSQDIWKRRHNECDSVTENKVDNYLKLTVFGGDVTFSFISDGKGHRILLDARAHDHVRLLPWMWLMM